MKCFTKKGLWVMAGAGFLLVGLQKQAWAGLPELGSLSSLNAAVRKRASQVQVGPEQKKSEKPKLVFVSPISSVASPKPAAGAQAGAPSLLLLEQ
jgi:hypothetical protein